jgi:hypothetical protein
VVLSKVISPLPSRGRVLQGPENARPSYFAVKVPVKLPSVVFPSIVLFPLERRLPPVAVESPVLLSVTFVFDTRMVAAPEAYIPVAACADALSQEYEDFVLYKG